MKRTLVRIVLLAALAIAVGFFAAKAYAAITAAQRVGPGTKITTAAAAPANCSASTAYGCFYWSSGDGKAHTIYNGIDAPVSTAGLFALTDAASIATDASQGNIFTVTLAGNRTLANPTNLLSGGTYQWIVKQDATGSRTLTFGTLFKFPGAALPSLTNTANAVDVLTATYDGVALRCVFQADFR